MVGEIVDAAGNRILLDEKPTRIASTTVTATEVACNLGFRNFIVGATTDSGVYDVNSKVIGIDIDLDYPGTLQADLDKGKITNVGTWSSWTAESVATCNPDLVLIDYNQISTDKSRMTQLQSMGITCIVIYDDSDINTIVKNYEMLGTALGVSSKAKEISDAIRDVSETIYDNAGDITGLKVAHICYCFGSYYIYDMSATMQVAVNLGATNALPTTQSFATVTPEDIAAANPDVIIFDDMATDLDWTEVVAGWKADPVMGSIDAIKNDDIYCLEYDPFQSTSYNTVHFVEGEALIATLLSDDLSKNVPTILTNENWRTYIQWLEDKV